MPDISVIICTHNPRADYLTRTLGALKAQTLPKEQWELLVIDNASKEPLANSWNLSWHSNARHVREDEIGLTPARFRGIREAAAEVLVFVDDDNVLAPDYLSNALKLTHSHPWVGAFGGNIGGEFETKPESWAEIMFPFLAIIPVKHEEWAFGSGTDAQRCAPCGAGMVIRKIVAAHYAKISASAPLRHGLDRKGTSLVSAGDVDMALSACSLGLAVGRFPQLQMTHLIAAKRLKRDYLLQLAEETAFSNAVLKFIWNGDLPSRNQTTSCRSERIFQAYKSFRKKLAGRNQPSFNDEFTAALDRGILKAIQLLQPRQAA